MCTQTSGISRSFVGVVLDHEKPIRSMSAEEILFEFRYLDHGTVDDRKNRKAVSMGLPPSLAKRHKELHDYMVSAVSAVTRLDDLKHSAKQHCEA